MATSQAEAGICMCVCERVHACMQQNMEILVLKARKKSYSLETHIWLVLHQSLFMFLGTSILEWGASLLSPHHLQSFAVPGRECKTSSLNTSLLLLVKSPHRLQNSCCDIAPVLEYLGKKGVLIEGKRQETEIRDLRSAAGSAADFSHDGRPVTYFLY